MTLDQAKEIYLNKILTHKTEGWRFKVMSIKEVLAFGGNGYEPKLYLADLEFNTQMYGRPNSLFVWETNVYDLST